MRVRKLRYEWGDEFSGVSIQIWVPESKAREGATLNDGVRMTEVHAAMLAGMRDIVREVFPWGQTEGKIRATVTVEEK